MKNSKLTKNRLDSL